jgi:predicted cation transporter
MGLEVFVSLLYFLNKLLLSLEKKTGWVIGILASATSLVYFLWLNSYIIAVLEGGVLLLMLYGFLNHSKKFRAELLAYFLIAAIMGYLLFTLEESTWLEFILSITFLLAIHSLASHKWILGWLFMGVSHVLLALFTFQKEQYFFAVMQICSAGVAVYAISKNRQRSR